MKVGMKKMVGEENKGGERKKNAIPVKIPEKKLLNVLAFL